MSDMLYIINPAGRRGAGVKAWKAFQESWSDAIAPEHVIVTEGPGHAREIATSADGYDTFATIGGDGTVGEVISGIMDRGEPDLRIAIIPAGTGNDIGRHVGIRSEADATDALRFGNDVLADSRLARAFRPIDLGNPPSRTPPTPSAISSERQPVEMTFTSRCEALPSFITAPSPNRLRIVSKAVPSALPRPFPFVPFRRATIASYYKSSTRNQKRTCQDGSGQIAAQASAAARMAQLAQCFVLDLADTLAREVKLAANLFQGIAIPVLQAKPEAQDTGLTRRERAQCPL